MEITIKDMTLVNLCDPVSTGAKSKDQVTLWLEENGTVTVSVRSYYGGDGTPEDEWHGRTISWGFGGRGDCSTYDRDRIAGDLQPGGSLHALLARVHAGHTTEWDGQNNVGRMTDDAREADEEIATILQNYPTLDVKYFDASDWLWSGHTRADAEHILHDIGLTTASDDAAISDAAEWLLRKARAEGQEIVGDLKTAIQDVIESAKQNGDDE